MEIVLESSCSSSPRVTDGERMRECWKMTVFQHHKISMLAVMDRERSEWLEGQKYESPTDEQKSKQKKEREREREREREEER
ncbi:hypothetical protein WMY93_031467, partial [Mugilogobius chulae]